MTWIFPGNDCLLSFYDFIQFYTHLNAFACGGGRITMQFMSLSIRYKVGPKVHLR